jgi:Acetyl xylan esterase (AXE1)
MAADAQDIEAKRQLLRGCLGSLQATQFSVRQRRVVASDLPQTRVECLDLVSASGNPVRAILTGPVTVWHQLPAILYCHAHGHRYDIGATELIAGRPALLAPSYGDALAQQGIVALSIDLPCFGLRAEAQESAASKSYLWQGRTLFGAMLQDLAGALDVLAVIEGVDDSRIGAFGLSMGATLAFWLAALDTRLAAVAHLCCFADLEHLIATGAHDLHGPYMTVPGLVRQIRTGQIAGLIAPRPQLACMGLLDPLTPAAAMACAIADVELAYRRQGAEAQLQTLVSADTGHVETAVMRATVLEFLAQNL